MRSTSVLVGVLACVLSLSPIRATSAPTRTDDGPATGFHGSAAHVTDRIPPRGALGPPERARYQYLSPVPGSTRVSRWNNIVIRQGSGLDRSTIASAALTVTGTASGAHEGRLVLSDDSKTLVFRPEIPFAPGEQVSVTLERGVRTSTGETLPPLRFDFSVATIEPLLARPEEIETLFPGIGAASPGPAPAGRPVPLQAESEPPSIGPGMLAPEALPPHYPPVSASLSNAPEPGGVFLAPFSFGAGSTSLIILDGAGMPLFYRDMTALGAAFDFKMQPNGKLTFGNTSAGGFFVLDSAYAVSGLYRMGNGYSADIHDFQLLPDGHALMMAYDPQPVDMSVVVPGGNPNATVIGLVLQELDQDQQVVFQWRSWDHFQITDCVSSQVSLTGASIDYLHGNAIDLDLDGNLLISSRHMNEITKINRQTGEIVWRMGLNAANNQFTFPNDARGFSHQHDIRRLADGHVTLFDNGNDLPGPYSRAVEYELDELNKVATQVWEYRNDPDSYGPFMGSVQRLPGGGTLIGWGGTAANPQVTEVHADGSKALELAFATPGRMYSYRALKFPWHTNALMTDISPLVFGAIELGRSARMELPVHNGGSTAVTINQIISTDPMFSVPVSDPVTIDPGETVRIFVVFTPTSLGVKLATLYLRQVTDDEIIALDVPLWGRAKGQGRGGPLIPTERAEAAAPRFELSDGRPNPFSRTAEIAFALPRDGRVRLEIFDVHGRKVETLLDADQTAGSHVVTWAPKDPARGIFFCRLDAGGRIATRKLVRID